MVLIHWSCEAWNQLSSLKDWSENSQHSSRRVQEANLPAKCSRADLSVSATADQTSSNIMGDHEGYPPNIEVYKV
jgi:hypothetical protein